MHRNKSFVKEIMIYLLILTGLLTSLLGILLLSSYNILEAEIKDSSDAFLRIYCNEFNNNIRDMDNLLVSIVTQGEDLAKLKSSNESERSLSSISLHNYMSDLLSADDAADVLVVYDGSYNVCLDAISTGVSYTAKNSLRDFTREAVRNHHIRSFEWNFLYLNNQAYLYKIFITNNRAVAIYVRTSELLNSLSTNGNGNRSIILANKAGLIGRIWGKKESDIHMDANIRSISLFDYYRIESGVANRQLMIYCYTSKNSIYQQIHTSMFAVAITVCLAVFLLLFILQYTRKEIATPMRLMTKDLSRIKNGEYDIRVNGNYQTNEFKMLQQTTNQMVNEIVGLKIQSYEKRIALQDMELKSIRLQLKPHFFLNALTTISSLNSQNKTMEIKTYIEALSKNVRYMFHAGFHTVSIKEEIRHVENYIEMQELKYPGCIFYLIDLPQELEDWKIPQMLIHTFIENEYKYALSLEEVLTILIKISKQTHSGEEMLLIEIEDNGAGYPQEVLYYMNGLARKTSEKGMRTGLWSIKRMMELMYDRPDLLVLENIEPHGCLNKIHVPIRAKHELKEERS